MRRNRLASFCPHIGLMLLFACGGGADSKANSPTVSEFIAMLPEQLCSAIESCISDNEVLLNAAKIDGCPEKLRAELEDGTFAGVQDAIDAGRVKYDGAAVSAYLDDLAAIGCGLPTTRLATGACGKVFVGTIDKGGDCDLNQECSGLSFCDKSNACPGSCTPLLKAGDDCEDDDQCGDGMQCSDSRMVCETPAHQGDTCGGSVGADCELPLSCIGEDDQTGAAGNCRSANEVFVGNKGDACDFDTGMLCKSGLSCVVMLNGNTVNYECHTPYASGAACNFGAPSPCPDGEYCDANISAGQVDGRCTPLPKAGEVCANGNCADDLQCDTDGKCHPINRLGQPCVSDDGCSSGHCENGACVEPEHCML